MNELTPEILAWLESLKEGRIPEPPRLRIEYDQAIPVGKELRKIGFELENVKLPNNYRGKHGGYTQKWDASNYISPKKFNPRLRVTVFANATHRPFSGSIRVEEIKGDL